MAKTVPDDAEPAATLALTTAGVHLPVRFRDHDGGFVVRTRWSTDHVTSYDGDRHVWPMLTPRRVWLGPADTGYVRNPTVSRGQVAFLIPGDDDPTLYATRLVGEARCPRCDEGFDAVGDFREHYAAECSSIGNADPEHVHAKTVIDALEATADG